MKVPYIILEQLGGNKFIAMTGCKGFIADGKTLRMTIPRNSSKANRLDITLTDDDLYAMRFYRFVPGRWNSSKCIFTEDKVTEVENVCGAFCEDLQRIFTKVTGMHTHL